MSNRIELAMKVHDSLVPTYSHASIETQHLNLVGKSRALGFLVSELTQRKLSLYQIANILQNEDLEFKQQVLSKSYSHLQFQIKNVKQKIQQMVSIRDEPYPSFGDVEALKLECSRLEKEIEQVVVDTQSVTSPPQPVDIVLLRAETKAKVLHLITKLEEFESHQSEVCESKMQRLSGLIEMEEKRLELFNLRRDLLGLTTTATITEGLVDFESRDVEFERLRLVYTHEDFQACEQKRLTIRDRIDELRHVLESQYFSS